MAKKKATKKKAPKKKATKAKPAKKKKAPATKKSTAAIHTFGIINDARWCRTNMSGQWSVQVKADLVPSAGEEVYVTGGPPAYPAGVVTIGNTTARVPMAKVPGTTNTYEGSMMVGATQPTDCSIECRFIQAAQSQSAMLENCPL